MANEIDKEIGIHGGRWESLHGGYFSSLEVATPLLEETAAVVAQIRPAVLVDLGGGTGYLLTELLRRGLTPRPRLLNLDLSARQLSREEDPRVRSLQVSLTDFRRTLVASRDEELVFIMRSVLHYFGKRGSKN